MSVLHEALKSLGPVEFSDVPLDDLKPFLSSAFSNGQLIVDSVPTSPPSNSALPHGRTKSNTLSLGASSRSDIFGSSTRSLALPPNFQALQKEWKPVKVNPHENPLGISVYKLGSKDGKGAWFARRSIHDELDFKKWRRALESEFPETIKVQGGPGEGNIRGIGGERSVECRQIDKVGKMEGKLRVMKQKAKKLIFLVFLLSAQFPGPTSPRDFVTMFLTSDQLPLNHIGEGEGLRHFMVVSRPCLHDDTAPREGYVRGQYESVEYIREIPMKKPRLQSASTTDLSNMIRTGRNSMSSKAMLQSAVTKSPRNMIEDDDSNDARAASDIDISSSESRIRRKIGPFDGTNGSSIDDDQLDNSKEDKLKSNPVEWIMITRSDPGGSVPRFMVERGTPGSIVSDASKFLDWASSKDIKDFDGEEMPGGEEEEKSAQNNENISQTENEKYLHNFHTNGHSGGLGKNTTDLAKPGPEELATSDESGLPMTAAGATVGSISSPTTDDVPNQFSALRKAERNIGSHDSHLRRSNSSISSVSSDPSFASALEDKEEEEDNEATPSEMTEGTGGVELKTEEPKQLKKLEKKKKKLDEKLNKAREKEAKKRSDDSTKDDEAIRKAEEKHRKEVERLERKKQKELLKVEEKKRKTAEKDEKTRILRELDDSKAEVSILKKEKENLRTRVRELEAANKALARERES
jgi:hypothetical protein